MSDLSTIADVTIDRTTQAVSQTGFGVPAIIAEFATSKTTVVFTRARYYSSLSEMVTDGWATTDSVYLAASKLKAQNPNPSRFMVGRIDSDDASLSEALTAISLEQTDWYAFSVVGLTSALITLTGNIVIGSTITYSVNGVVRATVPFTTDHAGTMAAWETAIEIALGAGCIATDSGRTMSITLPGTDINSVVVTVTGGALCPTATYEYTLEEADVLGAAAWAETEMKIYGVADNDTATELAGGLGYQLKALGYDRTFVLFHAVPAEYAQVALFGRCLPYDPGAQTWAFKTLAGVTADSIASGKQTTNLAGNVNIYTTIAGVSITRDGKVVSGEYIDIIRGIDWITARIQESVFSTLVNAGKIPYDDSGIQLMGGVVSQVLNEAEQKGILISGTASVTTPLYKDISSANKIGRILPDVTFTGLLEGAIQHTVINGTLSI